jgi:alkyl sulfatase BDS1-like metallo-beta-lactamase superfamily hydrolase
VRIVATQEAFALFCGGLTSIADLEERGDFVVEGRRADLEAMVAAMDVFEFGFEIVLP